VLSDAIDPFPDCAFPPLFAARLRGVLQFVFATSKIRASMGYPHNSTTSVTFLSQMQYRTGNTMDPKALCLPIPAGMSPSKKY